MLEEVLDAVRDQLEIMTDLPLAEGGFSEALTLPEEVWWGNPGVLAFQQYPAIYVEPVVSNPESETTGRLTRTLTIRIVVLADPREYYDTTEVSEGTASREMVRTMEKIELWFQKTSLRWPEAIAPFVAKLEVGTTEYAQQFRGNLTSLGAATTLLVDVKFPKPQ